MKTTVENELIILGTGALATLFAANLSAADNKITLLGNWNAIPGSSTIKNVQVEGYPSLKINISHDPNVLPLTNYALILIKSRQTENSVQKLSTCLARSGVAITLQNGIGSERYLKNLLGEDRVVSGVTTQGATLIRPGVVRSFGVGRIWLEAHPKIDKIARMLGSGGFNIIIVKSIDAYKWGKLVINSAINPLTAIFRKRNGFLISDQAAFELLKRILAESVSVASAINITLPYSDPIEAATEVIRETKDNISSTLQDIYRNVPTEIDQINGEIIRSGEKTGVRVPMNKLVSELVMTRKRLSSAELSDMIRLL